MEDTMNNSRVKIAVASLDGLSLSPHFGRSACFIVFEAADGKIVGRETRDNTHTAFAKGECTGHEEHPGTGETHSHAAVVNALRDCSAVLCGGMGRRAAEELRASGIQTVVIEANLAPDEAVLGFLSGRLKDTGGFCRCHG